MPSSAELQSIRLEVISAKNFKVPSSRIPAGIYASININSEPHRRFLLVAPFIPNSAIVDTEQEDVAWCTCLFIILWNMEERWNRA
ncbi:uncharacterized protein F5147DRAFT_779704 [Suillus discolor]|uniref:Uncharacterized protein n=1 Tax=Suillus discolor TaxID=1912936 RepID=A0A9P7EWN5_9AGAM|nr:uncharacterized protein F5147DRAFT_779704 [Suillus discolor]KAG2092309.1 hypothetical protein F5147DRAFT_779704 [Suillus discolor]